MGYAEHHISPMGSARDGGQPPGPGFSTIFRQLMAGFAAGSVAEAVAAKLPSPAR